MIERELQEGVLKPLPLDQGGSRHPLFYLYSNKDKTLGPATQILIELLRNFDTAPLDVPFAAPASLRGPRPWPISNTKDAHCITRNTARANHWCCCTDWVQAARTGSCRSRHSAETTG